MKNKFIFLTCLFLQIILIKYINCQDIIIKGYGIYSICQGCENVNNEQMLNEKLTFNKLDSEINMNINYNDYKLQYYIYNFFNDVLHYYINKIIK